MDKKNFIKSALKQARLKFKFQENPIIFYDSKKNIIFHNNAYFNVFKSMCSGNHCITYPEYLYTILNNRKITFDEIPLEKLLSETISFYFSSSSSKDYIFKTFSYRAGTLKSEDIYFSIFFEITSIKDKLVADSISALIKASQLKDNDTGNHIQRINEYSVKLSKYILEKHSADYPEIDIFFIDKIGKVASMHDVGKIGIPDYILTKPAKLSDEEFKIMQEHTINGAFILSELAGQMARDIALFHHEKWDGSGYPYHLKEDQIPLCARIVSIADVYDALRMKRNYKASFSHKKAAGIIQAEKGKQFDPKLVDFFTEIQDDFDFIYNSLSEDIPEL